MVSNKVTKWLYELFIRLQGGGFESSGAYGPGLATRLRMRNEIRRKNLAHAIGLAHCNMLRHINAFYCRLLKVDKCEFDLHHTSNCFTYFA